MKLLSDTLLCACLESSFILRAETACQLQRNFITVSVGGNLTLSLLLPDISVLSQVCCLLSASAFFCLRIPNNKKPKYLTIKIKA